MEFLDALAQSIRGRFTKLRLDVLVDAAEIAPFKQSGWNAEPRYTFVSDLAANIEASATPAVRRRARRAAAAGVELDFAAGSDEFIELWRQTCARRNIGLFLDPSSLPRLLDRIVVESMGEIIGARLPDGRLVAANVILYDESFAYFWLSGFDRSEPHHGASNQLCHLQTLRRAANRVGRFDWLGANTPGVTEYKASFGPRVVGYLRLHHSACRVQRGGWWRRLIGQKSQAVAAI
jgi:hypothetical protein